MARNMDQLKTTVYNNGNELETLKASRRLLGPQPRLAIRDKNIPICAKQRYASTGCGKENKATEQVLQCKEVFLKKVNVNRNVESYERRNEIVPSTDTWPEKFLYVSEYSSDIIEYLQRIEEEKCIPESTQIKYAANRSIVVNWLTRVQHRLALPGWTLHTAVSLLDKAICKMDIPSSVLQLVACTSLWIAAKYDNKNQVPSVHSFRALTEFSFDSVDMYNMEMTLLRLSDFKANIVDPLTFVSYYLHELSIKGDRMYYTCNYLLDIIYLDIKFSTRCPSMLAAAAVYAALRIYKRQALWKKKEQNKGFTHQATLRAYLTSC